MWGDFDLTYRANQASKRHVAQLRVYKEDIENGQKRVQESARRITHQAKWIARGLVTNIHDFRGDDVTECQETIYQVNDDIAEKMKELQVLFGTLNNATDLLKTLLEERVAEKEKAQEVKS